MRSDYVLYVLAAICFLIAGVFFVDIFEIVNISLQVTMSLEATAALFMLGIILAIGGYALRPKVAAPTPIVSQTPSLKSSRPPPEPSPVVVKKVEDVPVTEPEPIVEPPPSASAHFTAKCPECGQEVSAPKKTWKMAGRKDKSGKRLELTIGLFEHCGKTFRSVLNKRKI
jgi:hypothetical protein